MTSLEVALTNAARGWPQFPTRPDKRPFPGFTDWETKATVSADLIATWATLDYPGCLWATTPGRVDKTVIDIDRHPGKVDGFQVLLAIGVNLGTDHIYPSLSGSGRHVWYRGRTSSRNALYTSVDRKSVGGYVVTPYVLPPVNEVRTRLPAAFQGRSTSDESAHPYSGSESEWLAVRDGLTQSRVVAGVVKGAAREEFRGHGNLLRMQARLVHLGREGHGGVPEALTVLREMWLAAAHGGSEDPAVEWAVALRGAIRTFGGSGDVGRGGEVGSVVGFGVGGSDRGSDQGGAVVDGGERVAGASGWGLEAAS